MLKFSSETSSDWWFYGVYLRTLAGQFICMDHDSNGKHICIMQKKPALCTYTIIYIYHGGDGLFCYPSRYAVTGNELIENRWSTKLWSLSVLKKLFSSFFVCIHVRLGSKCHVKWSFVCHTEGTRQMITTLSVCVQWSLQGHLLSKF